jgi:hypothetical protein
VKQENDRNLSGSWPILKAECALTSPLDPIDASPSVTAGGGAFCFPNIDLAHRASRHPGRVDRQQRERYGLAPERKGVIVSRESLERESGLTADRRGWSGWPKLSGAQNGLTARRDGRKFTRLFWVDR